MVTQVELADEAAGGFVADGEPSHRGDPSDRDLGRDASPSPSDGDAAPAGAPTIAPHDDRPERTGSVLPHTVAIVGDSLTVAATDEITDALSRVGVRSVIVEARESRRMATDGRDLPSGVAAIDAILDEHRPDLWVVALGTNDVGSEVASDRFVADLRATIGSVPATAPVVWVDVWIRDRLDDVVEANSILRSELDRRAAPTLVVDWFSAGGLDGLISGDGVHLTPAGEDRFATMIADAVVELAGEPG